MFGAFNSKGPFSEALVTKRARQLVVIATAVALLRVVVMQAAMAQTNGSLPGERGDPYSPKAAQPDVQRNYPLPPPSFSFSTAPGSQSPQPPVAAPKPASENLRYPLPSAPIPAPAPVAEQRPSAPPSPAEQQAATEASTQNQPPDSAVTAASGDFFKPGQVMAIVGNQFILYGDVAFTVNQVLAPIAAQVREEEREQFEMLRQQLTRQFLRQCINDKLMYLEFERMIETNVKGDVAKLAEIRGKMKTSMRDTFDQELASMREKIAKSTPSQIEQLLQRDPLVPRMAILMRDNQAETLAELDIILRRYGSSLDTQIRLYGENRLGRDSARKSFSQTYQVSHQEMLDYYDEHAAEYALPAKARFEQLTVKFSSFPTRAEAEKAIAAMGNEVFFGTPLPAVARKSSQDPSAARGGYYDWIVQGSLASEPIDKAIFTLEIGKLSQIIEDERGLHIVRVLERQAASSVPFLDAQTAIKEAIIAQKREADYKKFIETLQTKTKVWTIYDEQDALAQKTKASLQR